MPRKRTIPRVCEQCGADFFAYTDQVNRGDGRFCSRRCIRKPRLENVVQIDGAVGIPLCSHSGTVRAYVIVDAQDIQWADQYRWSLNNTGYAIRNQCVGDITQRFLLHRELMGLVHGDGLEIDHVDRDKLNCRRSNMRIVTKAQNMQNSPSTRSGSSRYRGVSWKKTSRKWTAGVGVNGKRIHLGYFANEEEAAAAALAARIRLMPYAVD